MAAEPAPDAAEPEGEPAIAEADDLEDESLDLHALGHERGAATPQADQDSSDGFDKRINLLRRQLAEAKGGDAEQSLPRQEYGRPEPVAAALTEAEPEAPMATPQRRLRANTEVITGRFGAEPEDGATAAQIVEVPAASATQSGRRAGRVKTRLLGFEHSNRTETDPFAAAIEGTAKEEQLYPVGWIVVIAGPGRGASFTLFNGVSQIGRGDDQAVRLDFGDSSISRSNHAVVAYDAEQRKHFLGHSGKANIVRLNDMPVLSTEPLADGDLIRIGETTLRFVAFCGEAFDWNTTASEDEDHVANL
ncbi:FHA domain-containing protein [Maritimibacter sp. 55A14]|nr:FHA domain-containing protein [Maritimibacter sp. 55A14]